MLRVPWLCPFLLVLTGCAEGSKEAQQFMDMSSAQREQAYSRMPLGQKIFLYTELM